MFSSRKLLVLGAVLGVLVGMSGYFWFYGRPKAPAVNPLEKTELSKLNRLVMQLKSGNLTLEKRDGTWEMVSPFRDLVDPSISDDILTALKDFTLGSIVSENPAKYAQFSLDAQQAAHLQVFVEGNPKPVLDAYVGKNANTYQNCYFRFEASTPVYIANDLPEYRFRRDPKGYRWMKLFPVSSTAEPSAVTVIQEKRTLDLIRSSSTWTARASGQTVSDPMVRSLVAKLNQWNTADFGTGQETPDALGFGKPVLQVTLEIEGKSSTLVVGKIVSGRTPQTRYAQSQGRPAILLVNEDSLQDVLASVKAIP